MKISVIVPTFRRPKDLLRCIDALAAQVRAPDEVIIAANLADPEIAAIEERLADLPLKAQIVYSQVPGQINQLNAGLEHSTGDIIAMTDDDAAPCPDWLSNIERHYLQSDVAAVGGRDILHIDGKIIEGQTDVIGKVLPFGVLRGNHHIGCDSAREVDFLKGANWSLRRKALDGALIAANFETLGAAPYSEPDVCLALRRKGLRVIYDPDVRVHHYPSARPAGDHRNMLDLAHIYRSAHNETLVLLRHLPAHEWPGLALQFALLGNPGNPGLLRLVALLPREGLHAFARFRQTIAGRLAGCRTYRESTTAQVSACRD